ncbi:cryptochrome/photolyase family protein [Curvibacter sp. HBC28]|uniref:Cryptochrome/photolyase family protein n=1 Tax=Curvibacter microcysteis TaxID=3026419 RepID=A0ABT5MJQ1_9BURK|nr:cryptochrome/photolyase family protein [Curvibacter sp. HBC28]MDD0816134.1 cryptochrome/photolyase family protein [Curvibacter sp. HBC28]
MSPERSSPAWTRPQRVVWVLGDQLWLGHPALVDFNPATDHVLMVEAPGEARAVWNHRARIAVFLSAMRHFCNDLHRQGWAYTYVRLTDMPDEPSLAGRAQQALQTLQPKVLRLCEPGDWRTLESARSVAHGLGVDFEVLADPHFMCSRAEFARWALGKKTLRMEFFYRDMRRRHGVLMDGRDPAGGQWNYDSDNRQGFPSSGPGPIATPEQFPPDRITEQVLALVAEQFPDHPGSLAHFVWPVTRAQALEALDRFITVRLAPFGPYQDAMWTGTPWGWHSLLSVALNLHLLDPREVIAAAETAWRERHLPLASVEGFIRQILGWREFIRGLYWLDMPHMAEANHFDHHRALPAWYWTGQTRMACQREVVQQTLAHGYAHHIQRLMVTGQFALLAEVEPRLVSDWYLAMYVDAVEWVELPNTAGMALHATGPRFTSKPYIASGQYLKRMSNYCQGCAYDPAQRVGPKACPVSTLYWHFLLRHADELARNPRTALMVKSTARLSPEERDRITETATYVLDHLDDL